MPDKPKTTEETLQLLSDSLDADILTDAMTDAEVDQELRDAGGDPAAIVERGRPIIAQLLERRRLAWQEDARKKLAAQRAVLQTPVRRGTRSRPALLAEIQRARTDPSLGTTASVAFRKRNPEDASLDELEDILEEFEMLRRLAGHGDAQGE